MDNQDADALFELVKGRYGDRLTPEQLDDIRKSVAEAAERSEKLRSVPLENGDEPFSVFTPFRAED
jgi:hypothetical protein